MPDDNKPNLFKPEERLHIEDPETKKRVTAITTMMVTKRVADGKLDPNDTEAMKKAIKEAARDALAAYNAALDFVCK
jgi:hypothetical protein